MYLANQSNTQVYSLFGSEQRANAFDDRRRAGVKATEQTKFEAVDVPAKRKDSDLLSSEQAAVALRLQRYYQIQFVGPTPTRSQMLLNELMGRAEANSR